VIREITINAIECRCERCGKTWIPKPVQDGRKWITPVPVACGACKSAYWNVPRKENQ
jgi:hypothetical protein